jgi:hypothetical protein
MKKGRCATMTHDYKRHGTTTLFAALDILESTVIGRCMQRHRHQEFIRFLNTVEREVPADKAVHVVLDNYATHKHPKVRDWLARHRRFTGRRTAGRDILRVRRRGPSQAFGSRDPLRRSGNSRPVSRIPLASPSRACDRNSR